MTEITTPATPTVTEIRRGLFDAANAYYERGKTYSRVRPPAPEFDAWCGYTQSAYFALLAAVMLRLVAQDHGEEYAAKLVKLVKAAEDDGEFVYDANSDLVGGA